MKGNQLTYQNKNAKMVKIDSQMTKIDSQMTKLDRVQTQNKQNTFICHEFSRFFCVSLILISDQLDRVNLLPDS